MLSPNAMFDEMLLWVPMVEMSLIGDVDDKNSKIYFKTPMRIGKSFAATAFMDEEEKHKYLRKNQTNTGYQST